MARPFKVALSSAMAGVSLVADGGKIASSSHPYGAGRGPWYLGGEDGSYSGYLTRLTIWNKRLADATLQAVSKIDIARAPVSDNALPWLDHANGEIVSVNGAIYEVQSGRRSDDTANTAASQTGPNGSYIRFKMFANNPWPRDDIRPSGGSERTEFAGHRAGSRARFDRNIVDSIWGSDSFYIEKGDPVTTNWCAIGQMHVRSGAGPAVIFSLQNGEFLAVDVQRERGGSRRVGRYPIARGTWYHRVFNIRFDQSGKGFVRVWINGTQIADYVGNTGNSRTPFYYWKFGIYRSQAPEYIAVRYANMTIGRADLSAKIANPDPIPHGYCRHGGSC
jgi:hypothetical protein